MIYTIFLELSMGKKKSTVQSRNKKGPQKMSLHTSEVHQFNSKTLKKLQNKSKKEIQEYDDMGSLIFLKDLTKKKKLKGVDEKIELLKTELKSLLNGTKLDKDNNDFSTDNKKILNCNDLLSFDEDTKITSKILESNRMKSLEHIKESNTSETKDFKPCSSSTPSKFSVWLDKTIEEMNSQIEKEKLIGVNSEQNSTIQLDLTDTSSCLVLNSKSNSSDKSLLPQDQVEKLLYKSFVLQNCEMHLSTSEDNVSEYAKSPNKPRKHFCKSYKGRLVQGSFGKYSKFYQKGTKRRLISKNFSLSEVEVIDLEQNSSVKEKTNTNYVDLDLNSYNWNEPFDLDGCTEFHSNVEVINGDNKNDKFNNQNPKISTSELENNSSVCYSNNRGSQKKGVWECPICFEYSKGQEVVATQCGHIFCKKCIENHTSKLGKSCPSCRSDLKDKSFITLFNF